MAKLKFTNAAINDLSEIWDYTVETWSEKQAETYYCLLITACSEIAKKPSIGKGYNEIYPDLRGERVSKHIVFYRVMDDSSVEIIRILHEQMDLKNKWKP